MNLGLVFVNGKILPAATPAISVLDAGLQQGIGIYETLSVERGRPVFLREHLLRMENSRQWVGIPTPQWDIAASVHALIAACGEGSAALRVTLTAGVDRQSTLAIAMRVLPLPTSPLRLWISSHKKNAADPWEGIKTIGRARNAKARVEALAQGAFDALLPTFEGDLAEGSASNLYFVKEGALHTPPLHRGCLPGVTREKILACAKALEIPVREERVDLSALKGADLVLISNALIGLVLVEEVIGHWRILPHAERSIFDRLQRSYRELVEQDLRLPE